MRGIVGQQAQGMGWRFAFRLLVVAACFATWTISGARAESPAAYMQRVQNELIAAQRKGDMASFQDVLRKHMDVPGIGLTALGPHVYALPKSERPTYYAGMIRWISKYASEQSPQYPVAKAIVTGQGPGESGGTNVDSHITLRSGDGYDIRWLVVKSGTGYKVRDAQVVGFWMTTFLNDLFQKYISDNGNNPRALVLALSR